MLTRTIFVLFIFSLLFQDAYSIINGEPVQWKRYGYLAKVFARENNSHVVTSCTGTIISGSLVLTLSNCLINETTGKNFGEIVVTLTTLHDPVTLPAKIVDINKAWALLKIPTQATERLCPPRPAPRNVAQLNVRLSLLRSSVVDIDIKSLSKKRCWVAGFESSLNASDFVHTREVRRLELSDVKPVRSDYMTFSATFTHNQTACWDDAGAAMICYVKDLDYVLVGFFQQLGLDWSMKGMDFKRDPLKNCIKAREMRFTVISTDERLFRAIERLDLPAFVDVYNKCEFGKQHT